MSHPTATWPLIASTEPTQFVEESTDGDPVDLLLDSDGDLFVDSDGWHLVAGISSVKQLLQILLQMFLGEWFLNEDMGVPYFQQLLGAKFDAGRVRDIFRTLILSVPGVNSILSLTVELSTARQLQVTWTVDTTFGPVSGITEP